VIFTPQELSALGIKAGRHVRVSRGVQFFTRDVEIGDFSRIDHGTILTGRIRIGRYVHIAPYCVFYGKAGIEIGDYSGFGAFTAFHSESDDYSGRSMIGPCVPDEYRPYKTMGKITVGRNVLGGTRVTILPGVSLKDGVSIGAHSLVKSDLEPDTMYAGVPAKRIREKSKEVWHLTRNLELGIEP